MVADVLYVPFIQVLVGNLNVLEIKIKNYRDDTHSYTVEIIASTKLQAGNMPAWFTVQYVKYIYILLSTLERKNSLGKVFISLV